MTKIELPNRYREAIVVHVKNETEVFVTIPTTDMCISESFDDKTGTVYSFDPSGGPYIAVGGPIPGAERLGIVKTINYTTSDDEELSGNHVYALTLEQPAQE